MEEENCIFCKFISGEQDKHDNIERPYNEEYPFISLFENEKIFCFLSSPNNIGESDINIIPIKHYEFVEDVPKEIISEMFYFSTQIAGILKSKFSASNILLNNGNNAEQWIPHVHIHVIPKNEEKENPWRNLSVDDFVKASNELKEDFKKIQ